MENYIDFAKKHYNGVDKLSKFELKLLRKSMKDEKLIPKKIPIEDKYGIKSLNLKPRSFYSKIFKVKEKTFSKSFKTYKSLKPFTFSIVDTEEVRSFVDKNTWKVKIYCVMMEGKSENRLENITAGIKVYENGLIEEGYFLFSEIKGKGRIIYPDGSWCTCDCDFKDGRESGKWIRQLQNGVKITSTYLRGVTYGSVKYENSDGIDPEIIRESVRIQYGWHRRKW